MRPVQAFMTATLLTHAVVRTMQRAGLRLLAAGVISACAATCWKAPVSGTRRTVDSRRVHHSYFNGGNTIGSGVCDSGQDLLCLAAISAITRSHRSFPKLL